MFSNLLRGDAQDALHQRRVAGETADEIIVAWRGRRDEVDSVAGFRLGERGVEEHIGAVGHVVFGGAFNAECKGSGADILAFAGGAEHEVVEHVIGVAEDEADAGAGFGGEQSLVEFEAGLRADEKRLIAFVVGPIGGLLDRVFRGVCAGRGGDSGYAELGRVGSKRNDALAVGQTIEGVIGDGVEHGRAACCGAYATSFDFVNEAFA